MSERRRSHSAAGNRDDETTHPRNNNNIHHPLQNSGVNPRSGNASSSVINRGGGNRNNSGLMRRSRPSLAIKAVNFSALWESLERDLWKILFDPLKAKLTHDIEQLHNIVYKLSTCQCYELPDQRVLAQNPHATVIPQEGDIQPCTLYFMFKRLIARFIQQELIGQRLKDLRGFSLLKQYSESWKNFVISCEFMNKVFHYLNTDWINDMECKRKSNRQSPNTSDKNNVSPVNLKLIKHFSESNHVYHTRTTCYLLWREFFFERCDSNHKNNQDFVNIERHFVATNEIESPPTQDADENSPLPEEVIYFDKYILYHTVLQAIEKDRNAHSPLRSKAALSSSVDEYYPLLKSVIRSFVDLSLDIEEDYYFNIKYLHLTSLEGFNSKLQPFIGDYYNSLFTEVKNDHYKGGSKKRVAYYPLFYTIDFERFLLHSSVEYYASEVSSMISQLLIASDQAVRTYIKHALTRIDQESNKIILHYINASSKDTLTKICVDTFVEGMNMVNITNDTIIERSPRSPLPTQSMSSSKDFLFSEIDQWLNDVEHFTHELELLFKLIMKSTRKNAFNVLSSKLRDKVLVDISNELKSKFENCAEDNIDSILFIEIFIENYLKFGNIVKNIFGGNFDLNVTKDKAFKEIFNNPPVYQTNASIRSAESLARYTNHLLKANSKTALPSSSMDDSNLEDGLDRCVMICTLLNDMDVFVQFYKVFLSRRLLIFSSEGDTSQQETELIMINKLKKVCPFSHIYKIQTMINDLDVARNLNEQFKQHENETPSTNTHKIHLSCTVLTRGYWPLQVSSLMSPSRNNKFIVPHVIVDRMNDFSKFYANQHSGRHLTWLNILSKGVVRGYFMKSSSPYYEFNVSMVQLALLLPFNKMHGSSNESTPEDVSTIKWTVQQLLDETGLELDEFIQVFTPLHSLKLFDIEHSSGHSTLDRNSIIQINENFNSKKNKIALFQYTIKQYHENTGRDNPLNDKIYSQIQEDRRYVIQAAIVRILKARKLIEHKQLVNLLLTQLSPTFKPTTVDIKRAIDSLLQQEYMKRVNDDSNWYQYLA
ncbi:hypothetical protein C9374_013767 [Naegleria lovaniensis]|uniref:Cullin family profile domain-containing protein n=1 Tax=Naegleria lovaniensis TaxID=51637 RepID=A0AA88G992_NAELO|nr:uncharacterized protein C9374_013767 [Naegleria lovaniensis]KAG2370892.1 hypothetical protein C9374_013767 [Naegleria lovaniensis]